MRTYKNVLPEGIWKMRMTSAAEKVSSKRAELHTGRMVG